MLKKGFYENLGGLAIMAFNALYQGIPMGGYMVKKMIENQERQMAGK